MLKTMKEKTRTRCLGLLLALALIACADDKSKEVESEQARLALLNPLPTPDYVINARRMGNVQVAVEGRRAALDTPLVIPNAYSQPRPCGSWPSREQPQCAAYKNYLRERVALALLLTPLREEKPLAYPTRLAFQYGEPLGLLAEVRIEIDDRAVQHLRFDDELKPESFRLIDDIPAAAHGLTSSAAADSDAALSALVSRLAGREVTVTRQAPDRRLALKTSRDVLVVQEERDSGQVHYRLDGIAYQRQAGTNPDAVLRQEVLKYFPSEEEQAGGVLRFSLAESGGGKTYQVRTRHPCSTAFSRPYEKVGAENYSLAVVGNRLLLRDGKKTIDDQVVVRKAEKMPLDLFAAANKIRLLHE